MEIKAIISPQNNNKI